MPVDPSPPPRRPGQSRPGQSRPGQWRPGPRRGDRVQVRVPAKINLHLGVGGRREDGYHELVTVFHAVGLLDTVTVSTAEELSVVVRGEGAGDVPADATNLAGRAALRLARSHRRRADLRIEIDKSIPVAAGLAGGSADAAATLVACDALWALDSTPAQLAAHAAALGSDVAFCLDGGTAMGTGRGEHVSPVVTTRSPLWWVLAVADHGLSTAAVYAELDRLRPVAPIDPAAPNELLRALRTGDPAAVAAHLYNDLQTAALSLDPPLSAVLECGAGLGALGSVVAGSGATCAFLTASSDDAARLAAGLEAAGVCRTTRVAAGPVPGARVV